MVGHQCKGYAMMSNTVKTVKEKQPRNKPSLAEHYGEIGIKAVAAAVRFGNNKNSRPTRKEARPPRIRGIGRDQ
jgi:hypothetical protein